MNNLFNDRDNNFEREFSRINGLARKTFIGVMIIWVGWVMCVIAFLAGLGYVAYHFISKAW